MNALLFSDDVISQKYHNGGSVSFITTMILTIVSNVLSFIVTAIFTRLTNYSPSLEMCIDNVSSKVNYYIKSRKIVNVIKVKIYIYFVFSNLIIIVSYYYIVVFCGVYSGSQKNWFKDGLVSNLISLITSCVLCCLVTLFRFIGLKAKSETIYNISLYLNK